MAINPLIFRHNYQDILEAIAVAVVVVEMVVVSVVVVVVAAATLEVQFI